MVRVALFVLALLTLAGCSLGPDPGSLGLADSGSGHSHSLSGSSLSLTTSALGGSPSDTKVASLDSAPAGSFEKAPPGALADRSYGATVLDAEKARELINAYRATKGLKPLKLDVALTTAAKEHSKDLAKWDRISHFGSDGSNPWDRVKRAGFNAKLAAENVGTGQVTFEEVLKGWEASPGHNKNLLLADAESMGIALVVDEKTEFKTFWTLVLGTRL